MVTVLLVRLDHPSAQLPKRGTPGAAGYDLYSVEGHTLPPRGGRAMVSTGIAVTVPVGTYGRIAPRSGMAVKAGIDVLAGVVDRDYTAVICVVLINHGDVAFVVKAGDRIAQLLLERIVDDAAVLTVADLAPTERGAGGFGSTDAAYPATASV